MFAKMKTGTKILAAFALAVAIAVLVGAAGYVSAARIGRRLNDVARHTFPSAMALATLNEGKTAVARAINTLALPRADAHMRGSAHEAIDAAWKRIDAHWREYESYPHGAEAQRLWKALQDPWREWRGAAERAIRATDERRALSDQGYAAESAEMQAADARAWATFVEARRSFAPAEAALDALLDRAEVDVAEGEVDGEAAVKTGAAVIAIAIVAGALVLFAMGFALSRSISGVLRALLLESKKLTDAVQAGRLEVRGDVASVSAEFQPIIAGVNHIVDAFVKPIRVTAEYVDRIANGDVPPKITDHYEGDFNAIKQNLNGCIDAVNALVADAGGLARAAVEGKLATRADAAKHRGDFRRIVQGVNDTLDAVIGPLEVAASYVDQISKGQLPPRISAAYAGDFNTLKENLNTCIDAVNALVADAAMLARAGVEGKLATRADAAKHQGDFRKVIQGVNDTLDAVIGPLEVAAQYVDQISKGQLPPRITAAYAGDFNTIKENLNTCIDAVNALVGDAKALSSAAIEGRLATRADASRHQGDFRKIVEGVNGALDAVLDPVNEAAGVLEKLAARDLRARVKGAYRGDHAKIKDAINATGEALHDALAQVADAVEQVSSAAGQIAATSQSVSDGASEQASSLEETSSQLESMASMTRASAESAQQADALAQSARASAAEGAASMEEMTGAMGKIKASAESTSQIIKEVNEIAFQTNLLALNAAVEAARAGEAGRGFAVVAEEVRSLALRSKDAAQKTEGLIRESVKQAGEGEVTARHVNEQLGQIASGIAKVTGIVGELAASAREQASGIDQLTKAVSQMDRVTQQNAASSEESSSAAAELSGQSEELAAMVGAFQLERAATVLRPASAAPLAAMARPAKPRFQPLARS
jgi:methyl-accepting chemotaxis protein